MSRKRRGSSARSSRLAMKQRVHTHHGLGELQRAPSWDHAIRFKIGRTQRRVTTATPVRSPMEQGKEPSQRSFELTARGCVSQEDTTHSRPFVGDFGWHFRGSLLRTSAASCCRSNQPSQRQTCRLPRSSEPAISTQVGPSQLEIRDRERTPRGHVDGQTCLRGRPRSFPGSRIHIAAAKLCAHHVPHDPVPGRN